MKWCLVLVPLTLAASCSKPPVPKDPPPPVASEPTQVEPTTDLRADIYKIVEQSKNCSRHYWKDRGYAPMAYMKGLALMYAKQVCGQGSAFIKPDRITGRNSIQEHKDALKYYGISGGQLNTYTFLVGLGMRESSGKYCEGRDRSAHFVKDYEAEAGLYQMAYVARVFNAELLPLYKKYLEGELPCELDVFKPGVSCSSYDAKNHGNGPGVAWQELNKRCPAASVQWAAILIRSNYRHFGPIIRKEVEYRHECRAMLEKVGALAKQNCSAL